VTGAGQFQGGEGMARLLARGRAGAAGAAAGVGPAGRAAGAGDLSVHRAQAPGARGLVVLEGHGPPRQERQPLVRAGGRAVQQGVRLALFPPAAARPWAPGRFISARLGDGG
jgi:hypothetical protein